MKQTDILRRERELRRAAKKEARMSREGSGETPSVGEYINDLHDLFYYDDAKIYNVNNDDKILELLESLSLDYPEKQWDSVLRKAVKKSGVKEKEPAVVALKELMEIFK